ncbi:MAG: RNA-binding protein [Polyangiaceae bacterium]
MGTRVYVGNLSYNTDETKLREACAAGGREVVSVSLVTDRMTGQPRGFAFVEFANDKDAQAAIAELNGKPLDGRTLAVNEARERQPRGGGGGFGGGGGGGGGGGRGGGRGGDRDRGGDHGRRSDR